MRILRQFFRRPPIRMGMLDERERRRTAIRNEGFVSFFNGSDCVSRRNPDLYDTRLRRQKRVKIMAIITVTALCSWVVIESAQALSTF
ncbi:hypothetical protein [Synoicihabitans lomoniglobus]|uniref:Transmembrane protein n=1 Tax=Synoicihabitans lomoniglobus TaxID=2909285 RepID=A0AAE9ZYZ6_9BACT|nr:hypothetical protein [Opitutaceae bacterium LMO-M01]WED63868.1 hypothetical protein PXH66_16135 [Opitutaceae bacterium LMO-M01]